MFSSSHQGNHAGGFGFSFQSYSVYISHSLRKVCREGPCPERPGGSPLTACPTLYSARASLTFPVYRLQHLPCHLTPSISLSCLVILHSTITFYFYLIYHLTPHSLRWSQSITSAGFPCAAFTATSSVPRTGPDTWATANMRGGLGTNTAQPGRSHQTQRGACYTCCSPPPF